MGQITELLKKQSPFPRQQISQDTSPSSEYHYKFVIKKKKNTKERVSNLTEISLKI